MTNQFGPTIEPIGSPVTYFAPGQPATHWRSYQREIREHELIPLRIGMNVPGVGLFRHKAWTKHGDYYWSLLSQAQRYVLGMHLTQRTISAGIVECGLMLNSATIDPAVPQSWLGSFFFDSLVIDPPVGWTLLRESLDAPPTTGMQFWPSLASRVFRFVLIDDESKREAGLGVLIGEHLRFEAKLPVGPSRVRIHTEAPTKPAVNGKRMGIWFPHGEAQAGEVGGTDIFPQHVRSLSASDAIAHRRRFDAIAQRHRAVAYHAKDGHVILPPEWGTPPWFEYKLQRGTTHDQRNAFFRLDKGTNDPWKDIYLNDFRSQCPYFDALNAYQARDDAHLCRSIMDAEAAATLCNDTLAKLFLRAVAADVMLSMNPVASGPLDPSYPGEHVRYSMALLLRNARATPHRGSEITRAVAWRYRAVASALHFTPPSPERAYMIDWASQALELAELSVLPCGLPEDGRYPSANNGVPWQPQYGLDPSQGCCPSWQVPFWAEGIYALAMAAHGGRMRMATKNLIMESCLALYRDPSLYQRNEYNPASRGPFYYAETSVNGVPVNAVTRGSKLTEALHAWHHLSLAIRVAADPRVFFDMALHVNFPHTTIGDLRDALNPHEPWEQGLKDVLNGN